MSNTNFEPIKFYICVPVYKAEAYLDECVQSVLMQNYENYELILVDDGSPDRSGEICDRYVKEDSRIIVIHQENKGQISARKAAELYAKSQNKDAENSFVLYLDSDDTFRKEALSTIAEKILEHRCDLLMFGIQRTYESDEFIPKNNDTDFSGIVCDKKELYHIVLENANYNSLCRKAVSIKLLSKKDYSEFYHIRHGEDLVHSLEFYKRCKKTVFISDILYNYRVNPQSVTRSVSYENFSVDPLVRKSALDFLEKENIWEKSDFEQYFIYCRKILKNQIEMISSFKTSKQDKYALYDQLRSDSYYSKVIGSRKLTDITIGLLKHRVYVIIPFSCWMSSLIYRVKNKIGLD